MLDIKTLLVAVALSTGFCALARIALARLHPNMPGLWHWAAGSLLGALALGLISLHSDLNAEFSLSLPQILVATGYVVTWDGYRRFLGRRPLPRSMMAAGVLPGVFTAIVTAFAEIKGLHSTGNALGVAVFSLVIAVELVRGDENRKGLARRLAAWIYAANAAFFAFRGAMVFRVEDRRFLDTLSYDPVAAALLLWWLCITVAVTLCMMLMTSERLERELREQANRDPLTGALNRRAFSLISEKEVAFARRAETPLALMVMDLDHFKSINDVLGHAIGDRVLCRFVELAQDNLRGQDVFCRFVGEEFVALLPGSGAVDAQAVAERIRQGFAQDPVLLPISGGISLTASIGIARLAEGETLESLVRRADQALYRAKAAGRNRIELAPELVPVAVAFAGAGL